MSQSDKSFIILPGSNAQIPVPSRLSAEQSRTMFANCQMLFFTDCATGDTRMPNDDGSVTLEPGARYTLPGATPTSERPPLAHRVGGDGGFSGAGLVGSQPLAQRRTSSEMRGQRFGSAQGINQSPARSRLACAGGDSDDEIGTLLIVSPPRQATLSQPKLSQPSSQRNSQMLGGGGDGDDDDDDGGNNRGNSGRDADGFHSPAAMYHHPAASNNHTMLTGTGPVPLATTTAGAVGQQQQQQQQQHQLGVMSQATVRRGKMIMDRVHDHIMLPPLVCRIVDTPEFQRLRYLKQLGSCVYLYPGANHTRFEHSIGVAHLAGLMAKKIARRQPELSITDLDILCLMVAGLCHDLGHGPFSHLFEVVVQTALSSRPGNKRSWHHEKMSALLVRRIFKRLLEERDETVHGIDAEDINFIVLAIEGLHPRDPWPTNVGRPESKRFLLDIVANKRNGIDVDKLDYFMRDSLACYGKAAIDIHISRLINSVRALSHEGQWQIAYEEKMALSLGDIFSVRAKLHKYAYQHRTTKVVDNMIKDALMAAAPYFTVRGSGGHPVLFMDAIDDPDAFTQLSDWILNGIAASVDPRLQPAQDIIHRLHTRQLYSLVGSAQLRPGAERTVGNASSIKVGIVGQLSHQSEARGITVAQLSDSLIVEWVKITYGSSDFDGTAQDPISRVTFFNPKGDCNQGFTLPSDRRNPLFSPMCMEERSLIVLVRDKDLQEVAHECFEKWKTMAQAALENAVPSHNSPARRQREVSVGAITGGNPASFNTSLHATQMQLPSQRPAGETQQPPPLHQ